MKGETPVPPISYGRTRSALLKEQWHTEDE